MPENQTVTAKISSQLCAIAKQMSAKFTFKGRVTSHEEVFSATGLLPGLARRADQLSSLCLGYGLGVKFEDAESTLLGKQVIFDEFTPDVLRLLCILDILFEFVKSSSSKNEIALDELLYD